MKNRCFPFIILFLSGFSCVAHAATPATCTDPNDKNFFPNVDALVVHHTPNGSLGGFSSVTDLVAMAEACTNESLKDSGIGFRLNVVQIQSYGSSVPLSDLPGNANFHSMRKSAGADIVFFLDESFASGGGRTASVMESNSILINQVCEAYAVMQPRYAAAEGQYVLTHEMGHLFGAHHEEKLPDYDMVFPYAFAETSSIDPETGEETGSLMKAEHPRGPRWSQNASQNRNNAEVLRQTYPTIADYSAYLGECDGYGDEPEPVPGRPAELKVMPLYCYGENAANWSTVNSATRYVLQASSSSTYANPYVLYEGSNNSLLFNVGGTTYLRVKACNSAGCSGWRNGNNPAIFYNGCF